MLVTDTLYSMSSKAVHQQGRALQGLTDSDP
jgi:hypothetical protein